jgi:hypothetical protein
MIEKAHFGSFAQNGMWQTSQEVRHTVFFGFHTKFSKFHLFFSCPIKNWDLILPKRQSIVRKPLRRWVCIISCIWVSHKTALFVKFCFFQRWRLCYKSCVAPFNKATRCWCRQLAVCGSKKHGQTINSLTRERHWLSTLWAVSWGRFFSQSSSGAVPDPEPCLILNRAQIRALLCSSKSKFIPA